MPSKHKLLLSCCIRAYLFMSDERGHAKVFGHEVTVVNLYILMIFVYIVLTHHKFLALILSIFSRHPFCSQLLKKELTVVM